MRLTLTPLFRFDRLRSTHTQTDDMRCAVPAPFNLIAIAWCLISMHTDERGCKRIETRLNFSLAARILGRILIS